MCIDRRPVQKQVVTDEDDLNSFKIKMTLFFKSTPGLFAAKMLK